ncbi:MAG TPA: hypothetical protein VIM71_11440 [Lacunisphaera sp.]
MKTTPKLGLLFFALAVIARADEAPAKPAAPTAGQPAPQTAREQLAATMPKYEPPPPAEPKKLDQPADPDVLELPKMTVKQKPRPRLNTDIVYTRQNLGDKLAKEKFTQLDRVLNSFTIPLFGAGMAERALEEHEREKKKELNLDVLNLSKALEQADPAEAKALKEAASKP